MKKYSVRLYFEQHADLEVYAEDEQDAKEIAYMQVDNETTDWSNREVCSDPDVVELEPDEQQLRDDFAEWCNGMVYKRLSYEQFEELLRSKTGIKDLHLAWNIGDDNTDYDVGFDITDENGDHPLAGEHDMFYLPLRKEGCEMLGIDESIMITGFDINFYNN